MDLTTLQIAKKYVDKTVKESGAVNLIDSIKVNGVEQPITSDKSINLTIPTKVSELENDTAIEINNRETGIAWLNWTHDLINGYSDLDTASIIYSRFNIICVQSLNLNGYASDINPLTEDTVKAIRKAKALNPRLRVFQYIQSESARTDYTVNVDGGTIQYACLNEDGSWDGSPADKARNSSGVKCSKIYNFDQFKEFFQTYKDSGVIDGIFFDDWGYDWKIEHICYQMGYNVSDYLTVNEALNKKWSDLIDAAHSYDLAVITNGGFKSTVGDWYSHLEETDIICFESAFITSHSPARWDSGQSKIYDYVVNFKKKGLCKARTWSLNYKAFDNTERYEISYCAGLTLACGGDYVSYGIGKLFEKPYFFDAIGSCNDYTIIKLGNRRYQIKTIEHTFEAIMNKDIVAGSKVEEYQLINSQYSYDGKTFSNAYISAPEMDGILDQKVIELQSRIDSYTADIKKNAVSYWKMFIDDWVSKPENLADYTNLFEDFKSDWHGDGVQFEGDLTDFTATAASSGWNNGINFFVIGINSVTNSYLIGRTIEFGAMTYEKSAGNYPALRTVVNGITTYSQLYKQVSVLKDNSNGFAYRYTIPEGCTSVMVQWSDAWFNESPAYTMRVKDPYIIDVNEYEDEETKDWYTNLYNVSCNYKSAITTNFAKSNKKGHDTYDLTFTSTDPWGWAVYEFSSEEVIALRGHTLEFGCESMSYSTEGFTGQKHPVSGTFCYFGIGLDRTTREPSTYKLYSNTSVESKIWNEDIPCVQFEVPDDATYICVGYRSYGVPVGETLTVTNAYLYDTDESGLKIRGIVNNTALRVCRVKESVEVEDPTAVKNSLYITDNGHMYCYDILGNKTDIANYDDAYEQINTIKERICGLSFIVSGSTLTITDGTNRWTIPAN